MRDERLTSPPLYIDKILQVFEGNGNLHIIGGCGSGNVGLDGLDLYVKCLHLVLPMGVALQALPEIVRSLPEISDHSDIDLSSVDFNADNNSELLGAPIILDFTVK